jgi:hypothetical protein
MNESSFWKSLQRGLKGKHRRFTRHTDTTEGIPDVSYTIKRLEVTLNAGSITINKSYSGWIELKHTLKYPLRPTTIIRCHHFTMAQKLFIWNEIDCGGRAFILWRIEKDIYLIHGNDAQKVGNSTKEELASCAIKVWNYRSKELYTELLEELKR